jgi:hypothetical protein
MMSTIEMTYSRDQETTEEERIILDADTERWHRLGATAHLKDWLAFRPGLEIRRRLAMKMAHTNEPKGRSYNEAFGKLMRDDGLGEMLVNSSTSAQHILWLFEKPEREAILEDILKKMTEGQRVRLNTPLAARQRVEAAQKKANTEDAPKRVSQVTSLKTQIAELTAENKKLKASNDEGSLFDLRNDTVDDIADIIIRSVTPTRAKNLADAIKMKLKRPAG